MKRRWPGHANLPIGLRQTPSFNTDEGFANNMTDQMFKCALSVVEVQNISQKYIKWPSVGRVFALLIPDRFMHSKIASDSRSQL